MIVSELAPCVWRRMQARLGKRGLEEPTHARDDGVVVEARGRGRLGPERGALWRRRRRSGCGGGGGAGGASRHPHGLSALTVRAPRVGHRLRQAHRMTRGIGGAIITTRTAPADEDSWLGRGLENQEHGD
jgi:hypothetical protein